MREDGGNGRGDRVASAHDPSEDAVRRVVFAATPAALWCEPSEALAAALRHRDQLGAAHVAWIANVLRLRGAERLADEPLGGAAPAAAFFASQPGFDGVAFPVVAANEQACAGLGFVGRERAAEAVGCSDAGAELMRTLTRAAALHRTRTGRRHVIPLHLDLHGAVDGQSAGLAAYLACLLAARPGWGRAVARAPFEFAATGVLTDSAAPRFAPVDDVGLLSKARAVHAAGYRTLLLVEGQPGLEALRRELPRLSLQQVPADPADAHRSLSRFIAVRTPWWLRLRDIWREPVARVAAAVALLLAVVAVAWATWGAEARSERVARLRAEAQVLHDDGRHQDALARLQELRALEPGLVSDAELDRAERYAGQLAAESPVPWRGIRSAFAVSQDERRVLSLDGDGLVLWDARTGMSSARWPLPLGLLRLLSWRPSVDRALVLGDGPHVAIVDTAAGDVLVERAELPFAPRGMALRQDGKSVVVAGDNQVAVWDVAADDLRVHPVDAIDEPFDELPLVGFCGDAQQATVVFGDRLCWRLEGDGLQGGVRALPALPAGVDVRDDRVLHEPTGTYACAIRRVVDDEDQHGLWTCGLSAPEAASFRWFAVGDRVEAMAAPPAGAELAVLVSPGDADRWQLHRHRLDGGPVSEPVLLPAYVEDLAPVSLHDAGAGHLWLQGRFDAAVEPSVEALFDARRWQTTSLLRIERASGLAAGAEVIGHDAAIRSLAGRDRDGLVATGDARGRVWLWDEGLQPKRVLELSRELGVNGLAFAEDGELLAMLGDGRLARWNPDDGLPAAGDWRVPAEPVQAEMVTFSPSLRYALVAPRTDVSFLDPELTNEDARKRQLAFSREDVGFVDLLGSLCLCDLEGIGAYAVQEVANVPSELVAVAFAPDEAVFWASGFEGLLCRYERGTAEIADYVRTGVPFAEPCGDRQSAGGREHMRHDRGPRSRGPGPCERPPAAQRPAARCRARSAATKWRGGFRSRACATWLCRRLDAAHRVLA